MSRTPRVLSVALSLMGLSFALMFSVAIGCQESGIGRPCCTAGPGAGGDCVNGTGDGGAAATTATGMPIGSAVSDNDLKCATRICAYVQPEQGDTTARKAQCSDTCDSSDDCPDTFLCFVPLVKGAACCKKFCISKDFVPLAQIDPVKKQPITPDVCTPSPQNNQDCPNVPVK